MTATTRWLAALFVALPTLAHAAPDGGFYLKDGDRVVFYGDSITDQRLYTVYVEAYAVTRFPDKQMTFIHSGWGGDRVTGGGGGPIDVRLKRDVLAYKPTVVTVMLGMNDASYRGFDEGVFNTYTKGYEHLVETIKDASPSTRITLIAPSPFDDVTREPSIAADQGGYNKVLARYGEFVKELAGREDVDFADMNAPVVAAMRRAAELDPELAKKVSPDRVHPAGAGHLLMAAALLKDWNAPALVSSVTIDAGKAEDTQAENARVKELTLDQGKLTWTQEDEALPMPIAFDDPVVELVVRSSTLVDDLDRQMLKVSGLDASKYALKIDGEEVGKFERDQLAEGVNLARLKTPMTRQAAEVLNLTFRHNNIHFQRWRGVQVPLQGEDSPQLQRAMEALDELEADAVRTQRAKAQPRPHRFELIPQS